jgi:Spy/CpxP family protein refolding chaperone
MSRNNITKQLAVAAGILALSLTPGLSRAQSGSQAAPPDQSQAAPTESEGHKHGQMSRLNLTDDQKTQMKEIHKTAKSQVEAVNRDTSLSADQKQAKIHQIRRGARVEMVKMLTPEQREQMKARQHEGHQAPESQAPQQQPQA